MIRAARWASCFVAGLLATSARPLVAAESFCPGEPSAKPTVLFCDDFDDDRPLAEKYFEYGDSDGSFALAPGQGFRESTAMRARWRAGQVDAGSLKYGFGRNPVRSQTASDHDFREVFWRIYVRTEPGWSGFPGKFTRATSLVSENWAQSMIAHAWAHSEDVLVIDPASGTDEYGALRSTVYNDFPNLRWLGSRKGRTAIYATENADRWFCVEARVKLNNPGRSDGVFALWVNGRLEAERTDLNWVGAYDRFGINAVFIENYWNDGAPGPRERFVDNFVVATSYIGCAAGEEAGASLGPPGRPTVVGR